MNRKFNVLIALILAVFLVTGCTTPANQTETETTSMTTQATETTTAIETTTEEVVVAEQTTIPLSEEMVSVYPLVLIDGEGREITIEAEPERVISVAPSVTEILFSIGAGKKLVGRTEYCKFPVEASGVESIGSLKEPNIEKIAELNPDLVIVATHFKEETTKKLEELGIQVFVLKAQDSFDGTYKTILQAGQITNYQMTANQVVNNMKEKVAEIEQKVKGRTPVTCYYVVGFGDKEYTATGDTFMSELLTMAGGDNIAKDGKHWSYSLEKLVEHNPHIIFVNSAFDALANFTSHENYQSLDAVKDGRVIEIDGNRISIQGPRLADALEEVASKLHPEAFE